MATKLGTLQIIGTISECSSAVRVRYAVPGATVDLTIDGASVGGGPMEWPEESIALKKSLKAGKYLVAVQRLTGFEDSDSSKPVHVDGKPTSAQLAGGTFHQPFHVGARCVFLSGLFPGATVKVSSSSELLGSAKVREDGHAHVDLQRALTGHDFLKAKQTACTPAIQSSTPIEGGKAASVPSPLPAPSVQPIIECEKRLEVGNIVEGATIGVWRKPNGKPEKHLFDACGPLETMYLFLAEKLREKDAIRVQQSFPSLKNSSPSPSITITASKNKKTVPVVDDACHGDDTVTLTALEPGATVELKVGGQTFRFGTPHDKAVMKVPTLHEGKSISARQNLCGDASGWSQWSSPIGVQSTKPSTVIVGPKAADISSNAVTLRWKDVGTPCQAADMYELQISKKSDFSALYANLSVGGSLMYVATFEYDTKFHWRVRGKNAYSIGEWAKDSFTTPSKASSSPGTGGGSSDPGSGGQSGTCFQETCPQFGKGPILGPYFGSEALKEKQKLDENAQKNGCFVDIVDCMNKHS